MGCLFSHENTTGKLGEEGVPSVTSGANNERSIQLRKEHRLSSNTLCLTIYGKWRDSNNFIHEPAVPNTHLASMPAEHQYSFHTYLGRACTPAPHSCSVLRSKAPTKGTFWLG